MSLRAFVVFVALIGLGATQLARKSSRLATGMHLSVVCAEDLPRRGSGTTL